MSHLPESCGREGVFPNTALLCLGASLRFRGLDFGNTSPNCDFAEIAAHINDLVSTAYRKHLRSELSFTSHLLVLNPPLRRPLSFLFELFRDPQLIGTFILYSVLE
jgi:hypothetical protein